MVYESNYRSAYSDELYHYGVKGMKWGVHKTLAKAAYQGAKGYFKANGKQMAKKAAWAAAGVYGLNAKAYSKSNKTLSSMNKAARTAQLKKAQAAQDAANAKKNSPEYQAKVTKAKKAAKIGAAVAGTALAAYGAYKLNKFIRDKNTEIRINQGTKACHEFLSRDKIHKAYQQNVSMQTRADNLARAIDSQNKYRLQVRDDFRQASIRKAKQDSFATAAKNVYKHYRNK